MDINARCDKCKYWDFPRRDDYDTALKEINECFKAKPLWNCTEYDADYERSMKEEFKELKLFVQDGSDYRAIMLTKADFFCAHFEYKPV